MACKIVFEEQWAMSKDISDNTQRLKGIKKKIEGALVAKEANNNVDDEETNQNNTREGSPIMPWLEDIYLSP